ncbi:MAG TPA: indolepyruvate oxidoreductase subunit beta [Ruminococcaceae bacterium]|nr:indolepyruvate oxidoreductase subunit beta [Oscillospiraceae bacterium]
MKTTNIMIVGVGGQGTKHASRVIGNVFCNMGYDVKISEVHGMSQRGGSVVTYVRCGEKVASPIIEKGTADYIISFEKLEAARWIPYLAKGGKLIINEQKIDPMPVITGAMDYPDNILEKISEKGFEVISVDGLSLAKEAGNAKGVNDVLSGIFAAMNNIPEQIFLDAIDFVSKERFRESSRQAFLKGYSIYKGKE